LRSRKFVSNGRERTKRREFVFIVGKPARFRAMNLDQVRRIAVGSLNPVKVAAVRAVTGRIAPLAVVDAVAAASGVPDQPFGDEETIRGALARAHAAREASDAELGFGIEGGVVEMADGTMRTCAWAAVASRDGRHGVGGSLAMPLPNAVARLIRERGMELGHAMDELTGATKTKHGAGAVGILTAGLVDRQRAYEVLVAYALAPFLTDHW
jgi:inosine/xanthosine triphosphatase